MNQNLNALLNFIILCSKSIINTKEKDYILETIKRTPHNILIQISIRHGILPIVYHKLKTFDHIDSDFLILLKEHYLKIAQKNILMTAELLKIIKLLESNNIPSLAFKGPSLAHMAYGDITLRQYNDLDILVDEKDIFLAAQLISSINYKSDNPLNFFKNQTLLNITSDLGLRNNKNNTYVELHWKLFRKKISILSKNIDLWNNYTNITIKNQNIKTLNNELLIVYLCTHGSKHMWERIEWILDIDKLIKNNNINWNRALIFAEKMHSVNTLLLGLSLINTLFGTNIPYNIQKLIKEKENIIFDLQQDTLELLNKTLEDNSYKVRIIDKVIYHSKLYDSIFDKLKYYKAIILQPTIDDILYIELAPKLSFLYFIIRPFRLFIKYLKNISIYIKLKMH